MKPGKVTKMDIHKAKRYCLMGSHVAFFWAIINFLTVTVFIFWKEARESSDIGLYMGDPFNYLDSILIFICGYYLRKYSRLAAIILCLELILSVVVSYIELNTVTGLLAYIMFLYFFARSIRGAFFYHQYQKDNDPNYKPVRKSVVIGLSSFIILLGALLTMGVMTMIGVLPSTEVLPEHKIASNFKDTLRSHNIVEDDEKIRYFYSEGIFSILEGGNILTDKQVISYEIVDEELTIYRALFENIALVDVTEKGDFLNDTWVEITTSDEDSFFLRLSGEDGGDQDFIKALVEEVGTDKFLESYVVPASSYIQDIN